MTSIGTEFSLLTSTLALPLSLIGKLSIWIAHEGEIRESATVSDIVAGGKLGRNCNAKRVLVINCRIASRGTLFYERNFISAPWRFIKMQPFSDSPRASFAFSPRKINNFNDSFASFPPKKSYMLNRWKWKSWNFPTLSETVLVGSFVWTHETFHTEWKIWKFFPPTPMKIWKEKALCACVLVSVGQQ